MKIFEFALYRAACQKMGPLELEIAKRAAEVAEQGDPEASEFLRGMMHRALRLRYTPVPVQQKAHGAAE